MQIRRGQPELEAGLTKQCCDFVAHWYLAISAIADQPYWFESQKISALYAMYIS